MRISLQLFASRRPETGATRPLATLVELAVLADRLGFDTIWLAEHHCTPWNECTDPLTVLAHLAARTSTARLGAAVVNLGLHAPVPVAERAALVHTLSGGRLRLSLGKGFSTEDYELYGISPEEAGRAFPTKYRQLVERLEDWASREAGRGIPELWLATSGSAASIEMAAELGHGLLLAAGGEKLELLTSGFRAAWSRRHPGRAPCGLVRAVHLGASRAEAQRQIEGHLDWYIEQMSLLDPRVPRPPREKVCADFCLLGTAEQCREQLIELERRCGVTELICIFGIGGAPPPLAAEAMHRFAEEVLAKLGERESVGANGG